MASFFVFWGTFMVSLSFYCVAYSPSRYGMFYRDEDSVGQLEYFNNQQTKNFPFDGCYVAPYEKNRFYFAKLYKFIGDNRSGPPLKMRMYPDNQTRDKLLLKWKLVFTRENPEASTILMEVFYKENVADCPVLGVYLFNVIAYHGNGWRCNFIFKSNNGVYLEGKGERESSQCIPFRTLVPGTHPTGEYSSSSTEMYQVYIKYYYYQNYAFFALCDCNCPECESTSLLRMKVDGKIVDIYDVVVGRFNATKYVEYVPEYDKLMLFYESS